MPLNPYNPNTSVNTYGSISNAIVNNTGTNLTAFGYTIPKLRHEKFVIHQVIVTNQTATDDTVEIRSATTNVLLFHIGAPANQITASWKGKNKIIAPALEDVVVSTVGNQNVSVTLDAGVR